MYVFQDYQFFYVFKYVDWRMFGYVIFVKNQVWQYDSYNLYYLQKGMKKYVIFVFFEFGVVCSLLFYKMYEV